MHAAAYIAAGAPNLPRARGTPTSYVTSSPSIRTSIDVTDGFRGLPWFRAKNSDARIETPRLTHTEQSSNAGRCGGKVADGK